MKTDSEFWTRLAERYAKDPIKDMASYEHTLDRVRSYLKPTDQVLEVGCGTGTTALNLKDAAGHITATDFSSGMIDIALQRAAAAAAENVDFQVAPADWTPPDKTFDVILNFNLMHLLPDAEGTVSALKKSLKPGGLMITKTPCLRGNPIYPVLIAALRLVGKAPYVRMFSPAQIDTMLRDAGFEILETGQFPKKPPSHFVAARLL